MVPGEILNTNLFREASPSIIPECISSRQFFALYEKRLYGWVRQERSLEPLTTRTESQTTMAKSDTHREDVRERWPSLLLLRPRLWGTDCAFSGEAKWPISLTSSLEVVASAKVFSPCFCVKSLLELIQLHSLSPTISTRFYRKADNRGNWTQYRVRSPSNRFWAQVFGTSPGLGSPSHLTNAWSSKK